MKVLPLGRVVTRKKEDKLHRQRVPPGSVERLWRVSHAGNWLRKDSELYVHMCDPSCVIQLCSIRCFIM